jgi:hypothetical protein
MDHLSRLQFLFQHAAFEIASPSLHALEMWKKSTAFHYKTAYVHPHWSLHERAGESRRSKLFPQEPISIAFVGFSYPAKGWPSFCELVRRFKDDRRYQFFHFAASFVETLPDIEFVATMAAPGNRFATRDALEAHDIDVVTVLSPWPETFSFVAFEALAAGASIVCLPESGNVADVVRQLARGAVLDGMDEIIAAFETGAIVEMVKAQGPKRTCEIQNVGTTATLPGVQIERQDG